MVAIAKIIESVELEDERVLCLRYNPDFDSPHDTAMFYIEEEVFKAARRWISPLLAEEDFWKRLDEELA